MSDVRRFRVEVFTPVHVGSGRQFRAQLDTVPLRDVDRTARDGWALVDFERALASLPASAVVPVANALTRWLQTDGRGSVSQAAAHLARHGVLEPFVLQRWPGRSTRLPQIIREGMRAASGAPLLPGSSVKGALRTALFVAWFRQLPEPRQKRLISDAFRAGDARDVENGLFRPGGDQPHDDLLRALRVTDAPFEDGALRLAEVAVISPSQHDPKRRKERLAVEVLPPGATAPIEIALDDVLLGKLGGAGRPGADRPSERDRGGRAPRGTSARPEHGVSQVAQFLRSPKGRRLGFADALSWSELRTVVNGMARSALKRDLEYARRLGDEPLYAFLENLWARVGQAIEHGAWVLRVGWGQGWEGTTGAWVPSQHREPLKQQKKRASYFRPDFQWFPKTRRVVEAMNDAPPPGGYPQELGWIALWPDATTWVFPVEPAHRVEPLEADEHGGSTEPPPKPVPQIVRKFSALRPHEYASKLAGLIEEAERCEPPVRAQFAQVVLEKLEETGKRKELLKGKRKRDKWQPRLATLEEWANGDSEGDLP